MVTPADMETALGAKLPDHLHDDLPTLARLLADTVNGTLPPIAAQAMLAAESRAAPLLQMLTGQHIVVAGVRISFDQSFDDELPTMTLRAPLGQQTITAEGGATIAHITQELKQFFVQLILPSSADSREMRNRKRLLALVKTFWIDGVLDNSLHRAVLVDLGFASQPSAVSPLSPFGIHVHRADNSDNTPPPGTTITEVFDRLGGRMLILGAAGSGKTTTLLQLCRTLLIRAEQDVSSAVPVVFGLTSWPPHKQTLETWLIKELRTHYQIPPKVAQSWVENNQVLPLLDGLDEVAESRRSECVAAINTFLQQNAPEHLVVTSRSDEFEALISPLHLQGAIVLQTLTSDQIDAYFTQVGATLAGAYDVLSNDLMLRELVHSPLMLSVLTLAYKNLSTSQLPLLKEKEEWREHLLTTYIGQMLARPGVYRIYIEPMNTEPPHPKPLEIPHYPAKHTIRWLTWMAQMLVQRNEIIFYIERMQPSWLRLSLRHWYYAFVAGALGLCFGLLWEAFSKPLQGIATGLLWGVGVALGGESQITNKPQQSWRIIFIWSLLVGILIAFYWGTSLLPAAAPITGIVGGLAFGMTYRLSARLHTGWRTALSVGLGVGFSGWLTIGLDIGLPEELRAELVNVEPLARSIQALIVGIATGILSGGPAGLLAWLFREIRIIETLQWSLNRRVLLGVVGGIVVGLLVGLISEFVVALLTGLSVGLLSGMLGGLTGREVAARITPNQGIWRSAKSALVCFAVVLLAALLIWMSAMLLGDQSVSQGAGLFAPMSAAERGALRLALFGGLLAALFGGLAACLQHIVLRCFLYRQGAFPLNSTWFLDYATNRLLLRKVGGGYMFLHRALLDYFAARSETMGKSSDDAIGVD